MIQQMSIAVRSADRSKSMMKIPAGFVWNWGIRYTVYAQNGLSCWHSYGDGADSPVGLGYLFSDKCLASSREFNKVVLVSGAENAFRIDAWFILDLLQQNIVTLPRMRLAETRSHYYPLVLLVVFIMAELATCIPTPPCAPKLAEPKGCLWWLCVTTWLRTETI